MQVQSTHPPAAAQLAIQGTKPGWHSTAGLFSSAWCPPGMRFCICLSFNKHMHQCKLCRSVLQVSGSTAQQPTRVQRWLAAVACKHRVLVAEHPGVDGSVKVSPACSSSSRDKHSTAGLQKGLFQAWLWSCVTCSLAKTMQNNLLFVLSQVPTSLQHDCYDAASWSKQVIAGQRWSKLVKLPAPSGTGR